MVTELSTLQSTELLSLYAVPFIPSNGAGAVEKRDTD